MGFDVSWHPISQKEIHLWYLDRLPEVRRGDLSGLEAVLNRCQPGKEKGHEGFCRKSYREMLEQGVKIGPDEPFEKTHGFILAAVQGLFRPYYYTRGGAFSFLVSQYPELAVYTLSFRDILGDSLPNPTEGRFSENYSGGVFIPENQIPRLASDYMSGRIRPQLEECFGNTLPVFLKALGHAGKEGLGLLEATEIVEPNPLNLEATSCCSYLINCDPEGVMLYAETAKEQMETAIRASGGNPTYAQVAREVQVRQAPPPSAPEVPEAAKEPPAPPEPPAPSKAETAPPAAPKKKKGLFARFFSWLFGKK